MIHNVTSVSTEATPFYSNANSVTLRVEATDAYYNITLFNLPLDKAEHIARSLSHATSMSEDAIRADERAKVAARLCRLIGECA
jgi:hypothetical protein